MTHLGTLVFQRRLSAFHSAWGLCLQHAGHDSLEIGYQERDVFVTNGKCYEARTRNSYQGELVCQYGRPGCYL
jgi:hypothetical protein